MRLPDQGDRDPRRRRRRRTPEHGTGRRKEPCRYQWDDRQRKGYSGGNDIIHIFLDLLEKI